MFLGNLHGFDRVLALHPADQGVGADDQRIASFDVFFGQFGGIEVTVCPARADHAAFGVGRDHDGDGAGQGIFVFLNGA